MNWLSPGALVWFVFFVVVVILLFILAGVH